MTLDQLETALRLARRGVFSDDDATANEASLEITRLRKLIEAHPDEVARRDKVKQAQDERLLFRYL